MVIVPVGKETKKKLNNLCVFINFFMPTKTFSIAALLVLVQIATSCDQIITGCLECNPDTTECTQCAAHFRLDDGTCEPCADTFCEQCHNRIDRCTYCQQQYGVKLNNPDRFKCRSCQDANCLNCSLNYRNCVQCKEKFGKNGGLCVNCQDDINNNSDKCLDCSDNYQLCNKCAMRSSLQSNRCQLCQDPRCYNCTQNPAICITCDHGYRRRQQGCQQCLQPKCRRCNQNVYVCQTCNDGYGVSGGICYPCQSNCLLCNSNYYKCTFCSQGYGPLYISYNYNVNCVPCHQSCQKCNSNYSNCTECKPGYSQPITNQQCFACSGMSKCVTCLNQNWCTSCAQFYTVSQSGSCVLCSDNHPGCHQCDGSNFQICTKCFDTHYIIGQSCNLCLPPCIRCSSQLSCLQCEEQYYLNTSVSDAKTCQSCYENCIECVESPEEHYPDCTKCVNSSYIEQPHQNGTIICKQVCGDFLTLTYPCDNDKIIDFDGCNSLCGIEQGFNCYVENRETYCTYVQQLEMNVTSVQRRNQLKNQLHVTVSVWPPLHVFWDNQSQVVIQKYQGLFSFSDEHIQLLQTQFSILNSTFTFHIHFTASLMNKTISIYFVPNSYREREHRFQRTPSSQTNFRINKVYHYEQYVFEMTPLVPILVYSSTIMTAINTIASIALKCPSPLQSVVWPPLLPLVLLHVESPLLLPFIKVPPLWLSAGPALNILGQDNQRIRRVLGQQDQGFIDEEYEFEDRGHVFGTQSVLLDAFNLMFFLQIFLFLVGMIVLIFEIKYQKKHKRLRKEYQIQGDQFIEQKMISTKSTMKILQNICSPLLQGSYLLALINVPIFISSSFVVAKHYGTFGEIVNIVYFGVVCVTYIAQFMTFYFWPMPYGFLKFSFKITRLAMSYTYILFFTIISTMLLLIFLPQHQYLPPLPFTLLLLFIAIYRPYTKTKHNLRAFFIVLAIVGMLCFGAFMGFLNQVNSKHTYVYFGAILGAGVLVQALVVGFLIHRIVVVCTSTPSPLPALHTQITHQLCSTPLSLSLSPALEASVLRELIGGRGTVVEYSNALRSKAQQYDYGFAYNSETSSSKPSPGPQDNSQGIRLRRNLQQGPFSLSHSRRAQDLGELGEKEPEDRQGREGKEAKFILDHFDQYLQIKENGFCKDLDKQHSLKLCAIQISVQENRFINLKNAQQYKNEQKKLTFKKDESYINAYDAIQ